MRPLKWLAVLIAILSGVVYSGRVASAAEMGDPVPDSWLTGQYLDWATPLRFTPVNPYCNNDPLDKCGDAVFDDTQSRVILASNALSITGYIALSYQSVGSQQFWGGYSDPTIIVNSAIDVRCSMYYAGAWFPCSQFSSVVFTTSLLPAGNGTNWVWGLTGTVPAGVTILEVTAASVLQSPQPTTNNPFSFVTGKRFYIDWGDFATSAYGVGFPSPLDRYVALRYMDASGYYGYTAVSADYTAGDDVVPTTGRPSISSWWSGYNVQSIIDKNIIDFVPYIYSWGFDYIQFDISALNNIVTPIRLGGTIISTINPIIDLSLFVQLMGVLVGLYTFGWGYAAWQILRRSI